MTDELTPNDIQAAINAGIALGVPKVLDEDADIAAVVVPNGGRFEIVDLAKYQTTPRRVQGTYRPATVDALIQVVHRHADATGTTLWVHPTSGRILAVFNDNDGANADPGWRDHKAELQLEHTEEWDHWRKLDGQLVSQVKFANHIEEGMQEIVEPAAADMLELAQTIEAAQSANFRQATRLSDGRVQVKYEETIDAKAGEAGNLEIPSVFKLAIAPFLGENPYAIIARFRYRISGGNLSMGYKLDRPDAVLQNALDEIAGRLRSEFANIDVFTGEAGV